jgi:hypothetical protein
MKFHIGVNCKLHNKRTYIGVGFAQNHSLFKIYVRQTIMWQVVAVRSKTSKTTQDLLGRHLEHLVCNDREDRDRYYKFLEMPSTPDCCMREAEMLWMIWAGGPPDPLRFPTALPWYRRSVGRPSRRRCAPLDR